MKNAGLKSKAFWRSMGISLAMLAGLEVLAWAAPSLYANRHGHFPATMIGLMRSRAVTYNPGVTGYYERLFGAPHPLFMTNKEYERWARGAPDVIYDHSFRIRRFRPNLTRQDSRSQPQGLTTNSFGILGPERSLRKPPDTRRAVVLGDSMAQGWGAPQDRSFVSLLETRLNATHPTGPSGRFEILNFSVTGYDLTQNLDVAEEEAPRFEPDVYILALTELAVFRNWDEHLTRIIQLGIDPKYDFLRETISASGASRSDAPLAIMGKLAPFRTSVIRKIIERMQARAAQDHAQFLVFLVPSLEDGGMSRRRFLEAPELLASLAVPVIDLRDTFDKNLDLERLRINPFDVHPNERGHSMMFENLYAKLRARPNVWAALVSTDAEREAPRTLSPSPKATALHMGLPVSSDANWPQFRGPNGTGTIESSAMLPLEFGPEKHLAWKQPLPSGHSSPVVWGDRVFITGFDQKDNKLEVLCLNAKTGSIRWRQAVRPTQIEKVQSVSSPVTATPAVDGERVYAYFGSYGLVAYDFEGNRQWSLPLPVPKTLYGSGTSPVIAGDLLILNHDELTDGYLLALDRKSGKTVWRKPYPNGQDQHAESYSTPVVWRDCVILHRSQFVDAYDLKDGRRRWWVRAGTSGTSSVTVDNDTVYAATWTPVGEADQVVPLPDFAALVARYDKNGDGKISESEFPADLAVMRRPDVPNIDGAGMYVKKIFRNIDQNHDGALQKREWETFRAAMIAKKSEHGLLAIKPSGEGDVTAKVVWRENTAIPEVPSPLLYQGRVYLVRNGGIVTCLNAQSGKVLYRARLGVGGPYYSSPIAVNGRIYVASGDGTVVVFSGGDELNVLARNDLGEEIFATPAVTGRSLYIRTARHLYTFR